MDRYEVLEEKKQRKRVFNRKVEKGMKNEFLYWNLFDCEAELRFEFAVISSVEKPGRTNPP
jgi:hypothetical protein